jgi:hypothetical protein
MIIYGIFFVLDFTFAVSLDDFDIEALNEFSISIFYNIIVVKDHLKHPQLV